MKYESTSLKKASKSRDSKIDEVFSCCSIEKQKVCCELEDKKECCGTSEEPRRDGCGCN